MRTRQKLETTPLNFLDDPKLTKKFRVKLEKIEAERVRIHEELANCERLTEVDFAVRINTRG